MVNNGSLLLRVACVFLVAPALGFKKSGNLIRPATDLQSTEQLTEEPKRPVWPGQYQVCHKRWACMLVPSGLSPLLKDPSSISMHGCAVHTMDLHTTGSGWCCALMHLMHLKSLCRCLGSFWYLTSVSCSQLL